MAAPVQKLRDFDAEWDAKATQSAIDAAREATETINPRAAISSLSNVEWCWIAMGAVFAWIKTKSEHATAEGLRYDSAIVTFKPDYFPQPWDVGAVASILPALGNLKGIDWSKPIGEWSQNEIQRFAWNCYQMTNAALQARDVGSDGRISRPATSQQARAEREFSARQGGPLWDRKEYADDNVPF
jgi:hypothetical protein